MEGSTLTQQIMAIQRDPTLTDAEKAKKRQELLSGKWAQPQAQGTTGSVPAQLLSGLSEEMGSSGQKNLPNLSELISSKVCSQPAH
ncbi:hypothetical protein ABBQ38_000890 [Trebouxia sp. C0009 RCD-2024]